MSTQTHAALTAHRPHLQKPRRLRAGDTIAVVSPSWGGPGAFPQRYAAGKRQLAETFGVRVIEMEHTLAAPDWVAKHPEARARDIMAAFADPAIDGVFASIGGEDAVRLIPFLDLGVLRANPKAFLGFSDSTAIHFACRKAGLVSFYGPSIMAGFGENCGMHRYAADGVRKALFSADPIGVIADNDEGWTVEHLDWSQPELQTQRRLLRLADRPRLLQGQGVVSGPLIGGCAEVLEMLKGTDWWPDDSDWDGAILFYETSENSPPVEFVRYWLRNYAACGVLQRLSGILLARPDPKDDAHYRQKLEGAFREVLAEAGLETLPVLSGHDFGHTQPILTLPYGVDAEIDCAAASLRITEAGVQ